MKKLLIPLALLTLSTTASAKGKAGPGDLYIGAHGGAMFGGDTSSLAPDLGGRLGYTFKLVPKVVDIGPELGVRALLFDGDTQTLPWVGAQVRLRLGPIGLNPFVRAEFGDGVTFTEVGSYLNIPVPILQLYFSDTFYDGQSAFAAGIGLRFNIPGI